MTHTKKLLTLFLFCVLLVLLTGCSEKQSLSTGFSVGSLYSADEQRFCVGEFAVPLEAAELAETLERGGLEYTEAEATATVTQWTVDAPASLEGYAASLIFLVRTDGDSQTCDQITLRITEGDLEATYEALVAAATELFGDATSSGSSSDVNGNEVSLYQAWRAYTEYGIYSGAESTPPSDERGEASLLNILLDRNNEQLLVYVCE